ncbi:J domain-containing protein [Paraburkholderia sediminicola]|uniref:J domain-containing protein n=1 Tax=Paraburkholderia sediminicola TaxID=458836 RepID=UPI0038BBB01E
MHTHYDNLKVARNAPVSVIKAAYRALSQQYHPDKNNHPDAARIMRVLNDAWAVLGDEAARAKYDHRLAAEVELEKSNTSSSQQRPGDSPERDRAEEERRAREKSERDQQAEAAARQREEAAKKAAKTARPKQTEQKREADPFVAWGVRACAVAAVVGLAAIGAIAVNHSDNPQSPVAAEQLSGTPDAPVGTSHYNNGLTEARQTGVAPLNSYARLSPVNQKWLHAMSQEGVNFLAAGDWAQTGKILKPAKFHCSSLGWVIAQVDHSDNVIATGCMSETVNSRDMTQTVQWSNGEVEGHRFCRNDRNVADDGRSCG